MASFILGIIFTYSWLLDEIKATQIGINQMLVNTQNCFENIDHYRMIDGVERDVNNLGMLMAVAKIGTPFGDVLKDASNDLEKRINKLEQKIGEIPEQSLKKKAEFQIEKGKEYLKEVKFYY